jgi:hypothetical protein
MKAFIAIFALLAALAVTRAFDIVSSTTAGLSIPLLAVGGAGTGTTAAAVIPTITAIAGGAITLKALGLLLAGSGRSKRSTDQEDGLTFAFIAQSEPQACYRRLICDLATGQMPKSENDVIVSLFDGKKADVTSAKFDFDTAAEVGKALKNVDACEIRYSCPFKGEQIVKLLN